MLAVSDRVVSLCVRHASEQAKGKVVLPSMYGRTQEEASVMRSPDSVRNSKAVVSR